AEDGIRDFHVTGVQTCALPIFLTTLLKTSKFDFRLSFRISVSLINRLRFGDLFLSLSVGMEIIQSLILVSILPKCIINFPISCSIFESITNSEFLSNTLKIESKLYFYPKIVSIRNVSVAASPREIESHYFEDVSDSYVVFPIRFSGSKVFHSRGIYSSVFVRNITNNSFYTYNFSKV